MADVSGLPGITQPPPAMLSTPPGYDARSNVGRILPDDVRWVINHPGDPVDELVLTVGATAVDLGVLHPDAISATIQVQAQDIRWKVFGTPTAAEGFHGAALDVLVLQGRASLQSFRAIREDAADATLYVTFFD